MAFTTKRNCLQFLFYNMYICMTLIWFILLQTIDTCTSLLSDSNTAVYVLQFLFHLFFYFYDMSWLDINCRNCNCCNCIRFQASVVLLEEILKFGNISSSQHLYLCFTHINCYKSSAAAAMRDSLATIDTGLKEGGGWRAPFRGSWAQSNTMWSGPRSTSLPSSNLIHPAVWPQ